MSNTELHARIDALVAEDRLEEALELVDQLEPVSAEEFARILAAAPIDDEPLSPREAEALDQAHETIRRLFHGSNPIRESS
jgi:hypothetical protein